MNAAMFVRAVATHTARPDTTALEQAHRHAEAFHYALAEALEAMREIEDGQDEFGHPDPYWVSKYTASLGEAAAALQKMPVVWSAILSCELDAVKR